MRTSSGDVPKVASRLTLKDHMGTLGVRTGFRRDSYRVVPGLYAVGNPDKNAPVLVTANYKLTFDVVRRDLAGTNVWMLVLDTRGINVWCAAGKHLFSTREVVSKVRSSRLDQLVSHRKIILPQLAAPGVVAHKVKKECGFEVVYGPVRSRDLAAFLENGLQTDEEMRNVSFTLKERAELVPVEITNSWRYILCGLLIFLLIGGLGPWGYGLAEAWQRGLSAFATGLMGFLGGAVAAPLLLPYIPGRMFWLKGTLCGFTLALAAALLTGAGIGPVLMGTAFGSYMMMNFTGSTPYTSATGVEHEMKLGIPVQFSATLLGGALWIAQPFL